MISYILKTLEQEDYVFVERLGSFRRQLKHAVVERDVIQPPHYEVVFSQNDNEENNYALANQISRDKQCLFTEANELITAWVDELLKALQNNKSVSYEDFGTFMFDKKGNLSFESAIIPQLNSQFEGMEPIDLKTVDEVPLVTVPVEEPEPIVEPEQEVVIEPEPAVEPEQDIEIEPEPAVEPEQEVVIEPEPVVEPEQDIVIESEPAVEPEQEVVIEPEPVVEPEQDIVIEPEPAVESETDIEIEPEPIVESVSEINAKPIVGANNDSPTNNDSPSNDDSSSDIVSSQDNDEKDDESEERNENEENEDNDNDDDDDSDDVEEEDDDDDDTPKKPHKWAWLWVLLLLLMALGVLGYVFKDKLLNYYHEWKDKKQSEEQVVAPEENTTDNATYEETPEPQEDVVEPQEEPEPEVYTPTVVKQTVDGKYDYIRFEQGHYYAIAGSFPKESDIERHIQNKGLDQYSPKILLQDGANLRVCIGVFDTEEEAEQFAKGINSTYWVLK